MATLSPAREMMSLTSHTDKSDVILFRSNPEISHGPQSRLSNGSLTHGYHHHHHQKHNHYSQSDIPKYSVSVSEPQIDHEPYMNGGVLSRDYPVLRTAEVQMPSLDYDNVRPLTRTHQIEKKGGFDSTVHSINEHQVSLLPFPPLDSGDAVADGGGSVSGENGRHPSCGGYKGEPGDSRSIQGGSLNSAEADHNFTCAGAETSSEADAKKSQMGNELFSARTANVSDARADKRNNERVNNTGKPSKGTVYVKYTGARVTDTAYCKLHAETAFIDQPNVSYGLVRAQPETQRCDKLTEQAGGTQVYDVDVAVTNAQTDSSGATGGLSIIPDTVSTKHVGAKDVTEDRRFIIMPASVCTGTGGLSTREAVISTSSNVVSSSATIMSTSTSVLSAGTKDEPTEAVVSLPGADFSTKSQFEKSSGVSNTSSIRHPLSEEVAKPAEVTTSGNHNGSLLGPKLDLTTTHIPSTVVLLPELPMIVITPSIPEATSSPSPATSSPSPALSSPDSMAETISHSQPCESLVRKTDNVENNHLNGGKDISSTEMKTFGADDMPLSKPAPVGGVKVLPSKFTFNVRKFKEPQRTDSSASDVLSTRDTPIHLSTGPVIQGQHANGVHDLSSAGVATHPQRTSELANTSSTCGSTTTHVSAATPTPGNTTPSSVMITTDHSASGAALITDATVSGPAFTTEKAAKSSCVISEYTYPNASAATDTVACEKHKEDYWSDYAVPSDLPLTPRLEYSAKEVNIKSTGTHEGIGDHTKTNLRIVKDCKDRKDTPTSHNVLSVGPDQEDVYAIPIPKSQRLPVAHGDSLPGNTTQAEVPLKPPRSPVSNTAPPQLNDADDDAFDDVVMRQHDRATNQMKKSTTTGTLHSYASDYSNIPNAVSHKYDYFSLGRRPKRPRIKTLTDSQGMAVSLDMLLRSRRQSVVDMSSSADNEQTLSVDDILKSCLEFEDDCAFYRSRTNSDVVRNSSKQPLSFREVHNIKLLHFDLSGIEKQEKHNAVSSKPILKKGTSSNGKHNTLGAKQTTGASDTIERNKTPGNTHSKPAGHSSDSSSTHGKENEKQTVRSKKEGTKKPDLVRSYILSDSETGTEYHANGQDTKSQHSSPKCESSSGHSLCTSDYESTGDTRASHVSPAGASQLPSAGTPQVPSSSTQVSSAGASQLPSAGTPQVPSASTQLPSAGTPQLPSAGTFDAPSAGTSQIPPAVIFSPNGSHQHHPAIQTDVCVRVDTTSARPSGIQAAASDVSVTTTPPPPPAAGVPTPTINISMSDSRPTSLPHLKKSFVTINTSNGHISASSPVAASPSTEVSSLSPDFRDLSSSFSDRPSPSLSTTGVGSEPAVASSEGVLSLLSVDVREAAPGDSPSPGQRSPSRDPKLEAAEALKWLRAAGFPQYAQMFDDGQFPVDMGIVERDHDFLDNDSLQSLFRRLETLNRYAGIKRDSHPSKKSTSEEEDEDDFCALSERWEYQKSARRWSRKDLAPSSQKTTATLKDRDLAARSGSHDSLLADQDSGSQIGDSPLLEPKVPHQSVVPSPGTSDMVSVSHRGLAATEITPAIPDQTGSPMSPPLRRATSEKMKTAKNLFKKMEGMKSGKSRRQSSHRNIMEISGPVVADKENMQAKLEKLNCVDILHEEDTQLSPPVRRVNVSERSDHGLSSATESHQLPSSTYSTQASPQSQQPPSSPRPLSDFLLRSKEGRPHVPSHSGSHVRPSSTSPNQRPSLAHDSSFEQYYQAQTAFLHNLQSSPRSAAESVRKNNSETNLMEIFLVPQDHQPGRFPRVLQNGYIETEACGTAVNVRTGSVRLGRNSCMKTDHAGASLRSTQLSEAESLAHRLSVYDNCSPSEGKRSEESQSSSAIPSAIEVGSSGESKQTPGSLFRESTEVDKHGFTKEVNSDSSNENSRDTSRESSVVRTTWNFSNQPLRNSDHERSVSFESSTSSQSPDDSTLVNVEELASTDSKSSKLSSSDSFSSKSKVTHSSSVDSYFKGNSCQNERPVGDSSQAPPANTFQENYDEFDRILQEMYNNINDLTTFMDRDKNEKTPRLVRAATSPLPAGSPHPYSPLHVATAPVRPILRQQQTVPESKSPSSATSDLVHSPASPRSPQDSSEPLDFYGAVELDPENSSSGGEGSNTAESSSEDQDLALTDISHDDSLDQIIEVSRERRDSGVGHSLTRAQSDRRRKKIRWHSFQKSHRPDVSSRAMQINSLTVGQLVRLQKLSLLRLTGIMEKFLPVNKSGWNWMVPRFMKRHKAPDFSDKNVFGVPLSVMAQRTGQPLPQCVLYAMRYLRRTCPSAVGIFRKSGVKSKIQQLRDHLEAHPDITNFDGENAYNVADMLKTFFRDLPECLLTNKMSETFRSIYTFVPQPQRLDAIQAAILLLPDENREVLQSILLFLSDISVHEADHQMNASNLAVCFTPTVFHLAPRQGLPYSPKRNRKNSSGMPDPREIMEQKAAHECLLMMIIDCKKLFTVPSNLFRQLQVQSVAHMESYLSQDIGGCPADVRAFGQERIQMVLKESHDKNRGWVPTMTIGDVEVFHRKPMDDCLLKEWKLVVDIEAPPVEVLRRIMHERHTWDEDLLSWSVVERLDQHSDIFQFVLNSMAPHPSRNFCVLRYWRSDLNKGACALITMSVEHSDALEIHGVWAVDLGTYYLMEPCGSGRSRLTYITRVDTRGRMPEWYTKIFGHICANFLDRLKESFKQDASGPETKV